MRSNTRFIFWLLFLPVICLFYGGLFVTMWLWYPSGLSHNEWQAHLINFSIVYVLWIIIFYSNRLFEFRYVPSVFKIINGLLFAFVMCGLVAVLYFYFQPTLLLTPRRFLLVHLVISGASIIGWYLFVHVAFLHTWQSYAFAHSTLQEKKELSELLASNPYFGLKYKGQINSTESLQNYTNAFVVFPRDKDLQTVDLTDLFQLRRQGVKFVEYYELYEAVNRRVHLKALTELWFIGSVDYGSHRVFDLLKRAIDILLGLIGFVVFLITYPIIGILIKASSTGPVIFKQKRVGKNNQEFVLYKYRTMSASTPNNTWTTANDNRITKIGRVLRLVRLDELPQSWNILNGDMSIVGPRPEQVNIVASLEEQIPYYNERHLVKPGLTGWAQLHVYAGTLEETRRKLQYDLYYIKHRSLVFDIEIILKTIYNIITFAGR